jgi:hypothetical protein
MALNTLRIGFGTVLRTGAALKNDAPSSRPLALVHAPVCVFKNEGRGFEYGVIFITVHIACGKRSVDLRTQTQSELQKEGRDQSASTFATGPLYEEPRVQIRHGELF